MPANTTMAELVRRALKQAQFVNRIADIAENVEEYLTDRRCPHCGPCGPLDGRMIRLDLRALGSGSDVMLVLVPVRNRTYLPVCLGEVRRASS